MLGTRAPVSRPAVPGSHFDRRHLRVDSRPREGVLKRSLTRVTGAGLEIDAPRRRSRNGIGMTVSFQCRARAVCFGSAIAPNQMAEALASIKDLSSAPAALKL
jgi:hypothetical protein